MKLRNKKTGEIIDSRRAQIMIVAPNEIPLAYVSISSLSENWEDYTPDEPGPDYLVMKIQELENDVKELDERLKTAEEITERLLGEDNDRIIGKVKPYEPSFCFEHNQDKPCKICAEKDRKLPPREEFKRMKQDLHDWIEKNKIGKIETLYYSDELGRRGVMFVDKTNAGDNHLIIIGWPTIGLADGAVYRSEELLITGEAGEE